LKLNGTAAASLQHTRTGRTEMTAATTKRHDTDEFLSKGFKLNGCSNSMHSRFGIVAS